MIPKVIHYCWFGNNPQPKIVKKCIASWHEKCPDYEIKLWTENNFDLSINDYAKEAYDAKKYAFTSDFMRMYVLYNYGGIYLDTDFEVIKSFDDLLDDKGFTCFENDDYVGSWIFASEPNNPYFKEFLDYYENRHFVNQNGSYDLTANPTPITNILLDHGLYKENREQKLDYLTIYPSDYFCPYDVKIDKLNVTENSYGIHWFSRTWMDRKTLIRSKITQKFHKIFGVNCFSFLNQLLHRN